MQVCNAINHPEILLDGARDLVAGLINEADNHDVNRERIQKELGNLFLNRQWIITQARMGNRRNGAHAQRILPTGGQS